MIRHLETRNVIQLWTDALGLHGISSFFLTEGQDIPPVSQALSEKFSTKNWKKHITVKKMFAILHAFKTWLPLLAGCRLISYGDNTGVVQGLKHSRIVRPALDPLREIVMIFATHDIVIKLN